MNWKTLIGRRPALRLQLRLRRHAAGGGIGVMLAAALTGMVLVAPPPAAAASRPSPNKLRPVAAAKPVPVHAVPSHPVKVPAMSAWQRPATSWPATGTASDAVTASGQAKVDMGSRSAAEAAGISGVIFSVSGTGRGVSQVSLDYRSFAFADGGGYASRLRLVELPACALTTPGVAACRKQTPLKSANDVSKDSLSANVALPASASAVVAATTSASGSAGDYTATPLSEAGTWSAGDQSGAFMYSYPIQVPPVPGGLAPQVSLDYNSQAVDGLTSSTNNQASWIGDGWDYDAGFIERDYQSCQQNPAGATQTGDLCWSSDDDTTLSLGGSTTTLVDDPSAGWHAEADNGDKITYKTGSGSNGTHDDDYWIVTTPDGTNYYFGLNQVPGYASGDATTNSAWSAPVYATAPGQPCYNATFADSHCQQAWRWNLDYVTDSHGDAIAYFYNTETNYYAPDNGTKATASYVQGGALSKIEYGLRAGSVYGATPAAEVTFTTATDRTDVPTSSSTGDLACSSGATCDVISPTFWSRYRLTTITTSTLKGSALEPVDSWALTQDYPATGDGSAAPPMWLESITRTGEDGTHITLPPVKFAGVSLPNRVETATDLNDGYSIIDRFRLSSVTSETGGVTTITYDTPPVSCTSGNFPPPDANTTMCYPDYWTPPGATNPVLDWFNKYVVTGVTQSNTAGGTTPVVTTYGYTGAAWHYDDDAMTRSSQRTWDQWRGFRTVTTETGTAPDPVTKTVDTYFQGMDGDYRSGGGTSSVSLTSSLGGETVTDSDQFAGIDFESISYDGAAGGVVSDTVTAPWSSPATATQAQPSPLPALTAYMTGTAETKTFTALASGGYREADDTYTHDSYGRVTVEADVPDTSDASEDTCTQTSYASNTSSWLLDLPAEVIVTAVPPASCPVSGTPTKAELVSDTQTYYDGSTTLGAPPSAGNVTMTKKATSFSGTTEVFTTESAATYDEYGRVLTSTDADGHTTTTAYTPATGAEPTSEKVTDPMALVTTTTYDPARDLPLTVTNPADWVTTETYDALGRLTAVWTPGHATSGPADDTFSYDVSDTGPTVITTNTINTAGTYLPSETLYDSLGRQIETQTETPDGGRDITDTTYDSDGWQLVTSSPYYTTGAPSATLVAAPDDEVPSQTGYFYDGDGRVVRQVLYSYATEKWETDTSYGGDYTTVTPPTGGTAETTYTNGIGKTSYIYQYHSATPPSTPPAPGSGSSAGTSGWDQTAYTYTPAAQLATITDDAGNHWSYVYDLAGDQTSASDPDAGSTTSTYDAAGNLLSATDARGKTVSYTYDADNRKTAEYDTTDGAAENGSDELASWTYDTLAKGQPTSSTAYGPGGTSGTSYAEAVNGYNSHGLATGSTLKVSAGPMAGTYQQSDYYSTYANQETSYTDAAGGGLPAETVTLGYDTADDPVSVTSSLWYYVPAASYTELGQPQEYAFGTTTEPAWLTNTYDLATNRLTSTEMQTGVSPVTVDNTSYGYDDAGLITSEADTPADGPAQVQCFSYDYLGRLTTAWSQGSAGCQGGPSQSAESGAAAPYWEQYFYNDENDLTSEVSTPASGSATTTTFGYPAAGSPQPHAVTSAQATGPSGTSATSYVYNAAGDTTSIKSSSDTQTLNWNDAGQLASVTSTGGSDPGTTSYVYDANGNLLLQSDPGSVTLYLGDEELTENTATGAVTGTRYYTLGGVTVAARSSGQVDYLTGDQQGTDDLSINSATLAVTRRYYDPYGKQIGTPPSSWPGNEGFVGGTTDPATGLTNLGAREYNPSTGAFISPDALLDPSNPQDLNAYAYAGDDPSTDSDPSGAMVCMTGGPCGSVQSFTNPNGANHKAGEGTSDSGGRTDPGSGVTIGGITLPSNYPHVKQILAGYKAFLPTYEAGRPGTNMNDPQDAFDAFETFCNESQANRVLCGIPLSNQLWGDYENMASASGIFDLMDLGDVGDEETPGENGTEVRLGMQAEIDEAQIDEEFCGDSFSSGTRVLLSSGKTIPISELKPGDKVLATNIKTGKTQAEPVTAVLLRNDTDLYDLTVTTGRRTTVIDTTSNHLFWDPAKRQWVKAASLHAGEPLKTPGGATAYADGGTVPASHDGWMWDLTVPGDHDFYIDTAAAAVLVHNCPAFGRGGVPEDSDLGRILARGARTTNDTDALFQHLEETYGLDPNVASARLHAIKASMMEGNPDVILTWSGGVYSPISGDYLGDLLQG